jgi:hypothetical protein
MTPEQLAKRIAASFADSSEWIVTRSGATVTLTPGKYICVRYLEEEAFKLKGDER